MKEINMKRPRPASNGMETINSKIKLLENQVLNVGEDFLSGFESGRRQKKNLSGKKIIACGMGGSILAAEILRDSFSAVIQDYSLPKTGVAFDAIKDRRNTVVFCFSYSGNTEETLACAKQAKKLGLKTFGFSRGGKLKKIVDEFFEIPDFGLPRFAVPYWLGLIQGFSNRLTGGSNKIKFNINQVALQAKGLAKKLRGKKILIYTPNHLRALAHFWEVNLDETSKVPSFVGVLPDVNHHDLASFSRYGFGKEFVSVFLDDGSFLSRKISLTAGFFKKNLKIDSIVLTLGRVNRGSSVLNHLLFVYLTTLGLARYYGVDPFENFLQEKLKKLK